MLASIHLGGEEGKEAFHGDLSTAQNPSWAWGVNQFRRAGDGIRKSRDHTRFSSVQYLSHVRLLVTPWTAVHQASLSITNSRSLLKLMSIE